MTSAKEKEIQKSLPGFIPEDTGDAETPAPPTDSVDLEGFVPDTTEGPEPSQAPKGQGPRIKGFVPDDTGSPKPSYTPERGEPNIERFVPDDTESKPSATLPGQTIPPTEAGEPTEAPLEGTEKKMPVLGKEVEVVTPSIQEERVPRPGEHGLPRMLVERGTEWVLENIPFWQYISEDERTRFRNQTLLDQASEIVGEVKATTGVPKFAMKFAPFVKYIYPEEREAFMEMSRNDKVKDLLFQTLDLIFWEGSVGLLVGKKLLTKIPKTAKAIEKAGATARKLSPKELAMGVRRAEALGTEAQRAVRAKKALKVLFQKPKEAFPGKQFPKKGVTQQIVRMIEKGDISKTDIERVCELHKITPGDLAKTIQETSTESGQFLNKLSQIKKAAMANFGKDPVVRSILQKGDKYLVDYIWRGLSWFDIQRRGLLVTQLSTTVRNAISQAGRYSLDVFDHIILGGMKIVAGENPQKAFIDVMSDFGAIWNRLAPSRRGEIFKIMAKYPEEAGRIVRTSVHEVVGGQVVKWLMTLNRGQEHYFRRLAFDAKLTALTKTAGLQKHQATKEMVKEAAQHALEVTFAAEPMREGFKTALSVFNKLPLTLINPFPRFWGNAVKFLAQYNPVWAIHAGELAVKGQGTKAAREAAKAFTGTLMLGLACSIRSSDWAGERYYEVKVGEIDPKTGKEKILDLRGYAPFTSYLFLAELILHPNRIGPHDVAQGLIGINRIAGTGLVFIDMLKGKNWEQAKKMGPDFLGQYIGGVTVPLRTVKDFFGSFSEEEAKYRETKMSPGQRIYGPLVANVPGLHRILPEAPRITRGEPWRAELPWLKQVSGLIFKQKTPLEAELSRLRISTWQLSPRTGDRGLDILVAEEMGKRVEKAIPGVLNSISYKRTDDLGKQARLSKEIGKMRGVGQY